MMADKPRAIFVRHNGYFVQLIFADILYLESLQNRVKVHLIESDFALLISLRQLEKELPGYFCRVHRSFIVNTEKIKRFDSVLVWIGKQNIPISRQYRDELPKRLKIVLSDTRTFHFTGLDKKGL